MIKKIYLILIHILLVAFLLKSSKIRQFFQEGHTVNPHYLQMTTFHQRVDANLGADLNIFIGDSLIQGLAVNSVFMNSVNYGIGGDTTLGVLKRLPLYQSIKSSKRLILAIGHNDLYDKNLVNSIVNLRTIFNYIPANVEVFICSVFLIDENIVQKVKNADINQLNEKIRRLANKYSHINYIDTNEWAAPSGTLTADFHIGDGIHLNRLGNELWISQLKNVFNKDYRK